MDFCPPECYNYSVWQVFFYRMKKGTGIWRMSRSSSVKLWNWWKSVAINWKLCYHILWRFSEIIMKNAKIHTVHKKEKYN